MTASGAATPAHPAVSSLPPPKRSPFLFTPYDWLALAALWLAGAAFFAPFFHPDPTTRWYIKPGDFTEQFYPFRAFGAAEWAAGRLPLWNPYVFGGHPYLADPLSAVFYPPALLVEWFAALRGASLTLIEFEVAVHWALGVLVTYALARRVAGGTLGAAVATGAFMFGGYVTSYPLQQLPVFETAMWLPLVLLCVHEGVTRASSRWFVAAGVALALALLAGHTQTTVYIGYTALAYVAFLAGRRQMRLGINGAVLMVAVAAGLTAVQALPSAEFARESTRAALPFEVSGVGYPLSSLLGLLGPWRDERALYLGLVPLVLGGCGLLAAGRRLWFWGALLAVALVLSLGAATPVFGVFFTAVPGWGLFQHQERVMAIGSLAGALLAGGGAQALVTHRADFDRPRLLGVALGCSGLALVAAAASAMMGEAFRGPSVWLGLWLLAVAAAALLPALRRPAWLPAVSLLLVVADLGTVHWQREFTPQDPLEQARWERLAGYLRERTTEPARVRTARDPLLPANQAALLGVPIVSGDNPMVAARVNRLLFAGDEWRLWQLWNVGFYLADRPVESAATRLLTVLDGVYVHAVDYTLPRAWAVRSATLAPTVEAALAAVLQTDFRPEVIAVLDGVPEPPVLTPGAAPTVLLHHLDTQRLEVEVQSEGPALLVLSQPHVPGWQATVNGAPAPILHADYALQAVAVPNGTSRVVVEYRPRSLLIGSAITAITLLLVIAALTPLGSRLGRRVLGAATD